MTAMVSMTRLRRDYLSDGVFDLVEDGTIDLPVGAYTATPASHTNSDTTVIDHVEIEFVQTGKRILCAGTVEAIRTAATTAAAEAATREFEPLVNQLQERNPTP